MKSRFYYINNKNKPNIGKWLKYYFYKKIGIDKTLKEKELRSLYED